MANEPQTMATEIGQSLSPIPFPLTPSSPPTTPAPASPPTALVPPHIAPVPPPSPVQPSTAPPLLTYHHCPRPTSSPADLRPAPDPANTTDFSPLSQPIALRKAEALSHPGRRHAIIDEMSALHTSGNWELVPISSGVEYVVRVSRLSTRVPIEARSWLLVAVSWLLCASDFHRRSSLYFYS
ncbi:PREDICTED: merozoite surface protein CMZ-8-like [Nicotiana attenuata]|uniref:merozoite surface protein CMZ-8-like n=1 Tax=Nicotiana attenuata TaxID=49451 RepID=UPI0009055F6B|nr:PREDICTED: merozoite surface protein CMZ-8-like [Nicotiana attenuata]